MKIECEKCAEIVETTATTVVHPFICPECVEAAGFQDAISPRGVTAACAEAYGATESANAIIADLEEQVKKYRAALDKGVKLVIDLGNELAGTLAEKDEDIDRLTRRNIDLFIGNVEEKNNVSFFQKESSDLRIELDLLKERHVGLKRAYDFIRKSRDAARETRSRMYVEVMSLRKTVRALKNRGLFSRILNISEPKIEG